MTDHDKPSTQDRHEQWTVDYYKRPDRLRDPGLYRSACGDAAHMCDAVAADLLKEERTARGKPTKRSRELAAAVKRAGDAIWRMRDKVAP